MLPRSVVSSKIIALIVLEHHQPMHTRLPNYWLSWLTNPILILILMEINNHNNINNDVNMKLLVLVHVLVDIVPSNNLICQLIRYYIELFSFNSYLFYCQFIIIIIIVIVIICDRLGFAIVSSNIPYSPSSTASHFLSSVSESTLIRIYLCYAAASPTARDDVLSPTTTATAGAGAATTYLYASPCSWS